MTLPNSKINAYLSFAWWQDVPQWENMDWTIPHLAVTMTFKDYVTNQDPVLETALNYTDTNFILDPMEHLKQLFMAGKYAEVKKDGMKIAHDPAYKYYDFEKEFGAAGYHLFSNGETEGGLYILGLVAEIYPESTSALYSLASAQEQVKQLDKAKENYEICDQKNSRIFRLSSSDCINDSSIPIRFRRIKFISTISFCSNRSCCICTDLINRSSLRSI